MARPKTYIIKLNNEERAELQKTIHNKKTSKTILKRCQILLELDEVCSDIVHAYGYRSMCQILLELDEVCSGQAFL